MPPSHLRVQARTPAKRGFTLVELSVVVMLMGIMVMAVFTVGYFSMRDTEELKSQARQLAGFLEGVRSNAALVGRNYAVEYNLDEQFYFAWAPPKGNDGETQSYTGDETRAAGGYFQLPSRFTSRNTREYAVWIDRIAFPDGGTETRGVVKIEFTPEGGSHWHYIYLRNIRDEYYTIEVNPFTGLSEVTPGELKPEPPEKVK